MSDRKPIEVGSRPIEVDLSPRKRLRENGRLIAKIKGGFECKADCGKCCESAVEMLRVEWDDLRARPEPQKILAEHAKRGVDVYVEKRTETAVRVWVHVNSVQVRCPFLDPTTKKCGIYDHRPFVCRAYGQHWFFWCREGVACPPGSELPDGVMTAWGALAHNTYGAVPNDRMAALRKLVETWRAEDPEKRRDALPTYNEIKARFEPKEKTA